MVCWMLLCLRLILQLLRWFSTEALDVCGYDELVLVYVEIAVDSG